MSGHTPGPWKFCDPTEGGHRLIVSDAPIWKFAGPSQVAAVFGQSGMTTISDANARLIAAAPDLLALLERIVAYDDAPSRAPARELEAIVSAARAAIAKARGQS